MSLTKRARDKSKMSQYFEQLKTNYLQNQKDANEIKSLYAYKSDPICQNLEKYQINGNKRPKSTLRQYYYENMKNQELLQDRKHKRHVKTLDSLDKDLTVKETIKYRPGKSRNFNSPLSCNSKSNKPMLKTFHVHDHIKNMCYKNNNKIEESKGGQTIKRIKVNLLHRPKDQGDIISPRPKINYLNKPIKHFLYSQNTQDRIFHTDRYASSERNTVKMQRKKLDPKNPNNDDHLKGILLNIGKYCKEQKITTKPCKDDYKKCVEEAKKNAYLRYYFNQNYSQW